MDVPKMLSGNDIVAKGVTKLDASLPEIGLKDVIPNGSWLEQKQIQSALEARKHLIEVERIQKFGTLSQAIWRDELKLAEVIQKTGSHWQYMGHNVGKTLYLQPEETLFLMEVNCLLLKHNGLTVSLQKAYSLLLNEINITQYRVYASLSRIGYKILRHKIPKEQNQDMQSRNNHESNFSNLNTENISKSQSTKLNILTNIPLGVVSTVENVKTDENTHLRINKNKTQGIIETHNDKSHNIEGENIETDTIEKNIVQNTETSNNQNIETRANPLQNIRAKMEVASNIDSKKETNIYSMEVDVQNVKNEPNTILNICNTHTISTVKSDQDTLIGERKCEMTDTDNTNSVILENRNISGNVVASDDTRDNVIGINNETKRDSSLNGTSEIPKNDSSIQSTERFSVDVHNALAIEVEHTELSMDLDTPQSEDFPNDNNTTTINHDRKTNRNISNIHIHRREQTFLNYVNKLKKLTSRQIKQSDFKTVAKHFESIPDLFQKEIVTINVPDQQHIPRNIFVNNTSYTLNMKEIRNKFVRCDSSVSPLYNNNEVNANNVRRIRNNSRVEFNQNLHFVNNPRFPPRQPFYFRPFHFWRPQNNLNYVSFNMFFQRACLPNMYFPQRSPYVPRATNPFFRTISQAPSLSMNSNNSVPIDNNRKRLRNARITHLNSIKNLAVRLKLLIMSGSTQLQNIESLHRLLFAFNNRYKARLRLTEQFDIVNDENIVETIELDEDVESRSKKPRLSQDSDKFNENLNKLRQVALKLKDLEAKNKSTPKHKRALSKAIKTFNQSYDADIYMNKDYEVIDRRFIDIVSDSESDCVITEAKTPKRKKLKNPFYILKQRSEKIAEAFPSTSRDNIVDNINSNQFDCVDSNKYSKHISNTFSENWLPSENDFGRAEVVKKNEMNSRFIDIINDEYLYRFIENHYEDFGNWLEAKIAYLQHMEEMEALQSPHDEIPIVRETMSYSGLRPLIDAEDNPDMSSTLEKLRIIANNHIIDNETSLIIHFDVYNRDVQNFRKSNPPKPHFRIICTEESSSFPSADDVMALHSKYEGNVAIVFAVVGISSISYLQINPIDLPVYVAGRDLE